MATVKMKQIKKTVGKAIAYIVRDSATRNGLLVSTNAAVIDPSDSRAIAAQFEQTNRTVGTGRGSVLAHHLKQNFDPTDPIDPETAHRLGVELAEKVTGGRHEYVIATHIDKNHVHNHIIFNAVSFESGRKFRVERSTIGEIRELSDEMCLREGVKTLPPFKRATGFDLKDLYRVIRGDSSKERIRTEIDKAATRASTWHQFEEVLKQEGITVARRSGTLSFRDVSQGTNPVRDWKLGEAFTEDAIMARLAKTTVNRIDFDKSMIVRTTDKAHVVRVPGTRGKLFLTIPLSQVVQHGERTYRAYVHANARHVLADQRGNYAGEVATAGLYEWFATPREMLARERFGRYSGTYSGVDLREVHGWRDSLNALHQLEDLANTQSRWLSGSGMDAPEALVSAKEKLNGTRIEFQAQLVALTDRIENEELGAVELSGMQATLRNLEREINTLKRDVTVLTHVSAQRKAGATVAERIHDKMREQERRRTLAHDVAEDDREARDPDRDGDLGTPNDPDRDGDLGTKRTQTQDRRPSLADRIAERAAMQRTTREERNEGRKR